jgi:O-succinylhomoserine sulfhydrylase
MKWGAHLVHSATKLMDGQGRVGGVTVGDPELIQKIYLFSLGPSLSHLMLGCYQKFRDFSDSFR